MKLFQMVCKRFQLFSMIIEFSASLTWLYASYSVNYPTSRYQLYLVIHIVHSARVRLKAGGAVRLSRETACIWVPFKRWKWMIIITVAEKNGKYVFVIIIWFEMHLFAFVYCLLSWFVYYWDVELLLLKTDGLSHDAIVKKRRRIEMTWNNIDSEFRF